ncbi:MAG TPA: pyridoxal-phosphate dependent enzyme [Thermoanaerobaculia bacterium]|nr:pyridoxal-phosphate dependent enzyme [Thermoanaerobaculia bacterium]
MSETEPGDVALEPPALAAVEAAAARIAGIAERTPTLRLDPEDADPGLDVWLKLETLQPIGSFKLRGAANALATARPEELAAGVVTASAGNMAQGVAWCARRYGVPCRVIAPDHAPRVKLDAIERLGGTVTLVPFDRWWRTLEERRYPGIEGRFVHPVADPAVLAGNATIALEILADVPEVDTILVPFGGGGLACGIAAAAKARRPDVQVLACEVETAAPFTAALTARRPVAVTYQPSFVDGIGSRRVLDEIWPLARRLLDGSVVVTLRQVREAIRHLVERRRVIAEGAGAASVAAALAGDTGRFGRTVCVVSGGNLDPAVLAGILAATEPGRVDEGGVATDPGAHS